MNSNERGEFDATGAYPQPVTAIVGDFQVTVEDISSASKRICRLAEERSSTTVRLVNAYCVAVARKDRIYRSTLTTGGLNYADGRPVAMLAKRWAPKSGIRTCHVRGPALFESVLDISQDRNLKHFFLGSDPATLALLTSTVRRQYPGLQFVGEYSPPFAPADAAFLETCAAQVRGTGASIVWVGLGTPKQDIVADYISDRCETVAIGVGAAFNFKAGTVREAPRFVQRAGVEWLFRFIAEPKRLWRRYTVSNVEFLMVVIQDRWLKIRQQKARKSPSRSNGYREKRSTGLEEMTDGARDSE